MWGDKASAEFLKRRDVELNGPVMHGALESRVCALHADVDGVGGGEERRRMSPWQMDEEEARDKYPLASLAEDSSSESETPPLSTSSLLSGSICASSVASASCGQCGQGPGEISARQHVVGTIECSMGLGKDNGGLKL